MGYGTSTGGNILEVSDGARVESQSLYLGNDRYSGRALITGGGTEWIIEGWVWVGEYSTGNILHIENGASVTCSNAGIIGFYSEAKVSGEGSRWQIDGSLTVHDWGAGYIVAVEQPAGARQDQESALGVEGDIGWCRDGLRHVVRVGGREQ